MYRMIALAAAVVLGLGLFTIDEFHSKQNDT